MEVRVTPDLLEISLVMTVSLWPQMAMKEVGMIVLIGPSDSE